MILIERKKNMLIEIEKYVAENINFKENYNIDSNNLFNNLWYCRSFCNAENKREKYYY